MHTHCFTDPQFRFKSVVEIGKFMVSVEIDDLPKANFLAHGLASFIHGNPEASSALLKFHAQEAWQVQLSEEQTLLRMRDVMKVRGYPSLSSIIDNHVKNSSLESSLVDYWHNTLAPEIMRHAIDSNIPKDHSFDVMMAWCNPHVANQRLHPRAIRFIENHWPAIVKMHLSKAKAFEKMA